ncbi:hypothetical protein ABVG11_32305 [Streptomyces sp. HD1123-B1]|uniref:hypothetical protein n=1 Tax=Streptomyces huangiella TaxID=3228804 RepID=UPI003D7CBECA
MPTAPYGELLTTMQEFTLHLAPQGHAASLYPSLSSARRSIGEPAFSEDRKYIFWKLTT